MSFSTANFSSSHTISCFAALTRRCLSLSWGPLYEYVICDVPYTWISIYTQTDNMRWLSHVAKICSAKKKSQERVPSALTSKWNGTAAVRERASRQHAWCARAFYVGLNRHSILKIVPACPYILHAPLTSTRAPFVCCVRGIHMCGTDTARDGRRHHAMTMQLRPAQTKESAASLATTNERDEWANERA